MPDADVDILMCSSENTPNQGVVWVHFRDDWKVDNGGAGTGLAAMGAFQSASAA